MELVQFARTLSPIFSSGFIDTIINYLRYPILHFNGSMHPFVDSDKYDVCPGEECFNFWGWEQWEEQSFYFGIDNYNVIYWLIYQHPPNGYTYLNIQMDTGKIDSQGRRVINDCCINIQIGELIVNEPRIFKWLYDRNGVSFRLQLQSDLNLRKPFNILWLARHLNGGYRV